MLHLMVDTSTWLDLARRRNGQRWIVALRLLVQDGTIELLVPPVVVEEFGRNRQRIEDSMTAGIAQRFKLLRQDVLDFGGDEASSALEFIEELSHQMPLIGAMTTRNFDDIEALLRDGRSVVMDDEGRQRVISRALQKRAPFHRNKNSVADATLIETFGALAGVADLATEPHAFVSSNHDDFSAPGTDHRKPHPDFEDFFDGETSTYHLGVDGLDAALRQAFGEDFDELLEEVDFQEEPRRLDEIQEAEQEFFDRIWYNRSLGHEAQLEVEAKAALEHLRKVAGPARRRVEERYGAENLGPYTDFEWGMLNGKLSALRWVLGSEWDFLDT
jgi:PIN domain